MSGTIPRFDNKHFVCEEPVHRLYLFDVVRLQTRIWIFPKPILDLLKRKATAAESYWLRDLAGSDPFSRLDDWLQTTYHFGLNCSGVQGNDGSPIVTPGPKLSIAHTKKLLCLDEVEFCLFLKLLPCSSYPLSQEGFNNSGFYCKLNNVALVPFR